ncbi:DUF2079 domain-containing protein [Ruania albidiflava]|uniref:DUF2079 domain-containing protein n=1 Tax=Ruania albidiflava TaxID=366586 RepID=UPI0003B3BAA9|nr:DUF2079 domain-containing protein [Ruania albidiflava]
MDGLAPVTRSGSPTVGSAAAGWQAPEGDRRTRLVVAGAVGALVTALYTVFSLRQWHRFEVPSWDLGIFTQVLRRYSELQAPVVTIKGEGFMILGDHFHPLLAVLAPVYRLFPSGLTLLVVQDVLVGISVVIVTACAARHLSTVTGAGIGLAYGLSWGLQSAVAAQFHEVALAVPLLAACCAALVRHDHRAAALWVAPTVLVKETMGLTVAAVGVVLLVRGSRRLGGSLVAGGLVAFWLTTNVILPALNPDGVWAYADDSILAVLLSDPGQAVNVLLAGAGAKLLLVLAVLAITGFLALRSPIELITVPTFAWRLTSDVPYHWSLQWHYSAVLMPVVFLALVDALRLLPVLRARSRWVAAGLVATSLAVSTHFPLADLAEARSYRPSAQDGGAHAALALVPEGGVVATDITLMAYLAPRAQVYWVGNEGNPVPDYVVVNRHSGVYGGNPPQDVVDYATDKFPGAQFIEVLDEDGFAVAERTG